MIERINFPSGVYEGEEERKRFPTNDCISSGDRFCPYLIAVERARERARSSAISSFRSLPFSIALNIICCINSIGFDPSVPDGTAFIP